MASSISFSQREARRLWRYRKGNRARDRRSGPAAAASGCTGSAVDVDAHDSGALGQRGIPRWKRWPEDREDWRADRGGEMHRSGISGDEQRQALEHRCQDDDIDPVAVEFRRGAHRMATRRVRRQGPALSADQPMSTTDAPRVRAISAPSSAKRVGSHLDSPAGRGLDAHQRCVDCRRADEFRRPAARVVGEVQGGNGCNRCDRCEGCNRCDGCECVRDERPCVLRNVRSWIRGQSHRSGQSLRLLTEIPRGVVRQTTRAADCCGCRARS